MTDSPATPEPAVRTRPRGRHTQSAFQLSMGDLLGASFSIYLRNLPAFVLLGVVVQAPWIALYLYVWQNPPSLRSLGLVTSGLNLLSMLLALVLTGAVTFGVVQQMRGAPADFAQSFAKGMSSFFRVLGTGFLCGLRIFLFSLLLVVPGIIEAVRLYVAIPAAIMEGKSGGAAVERSVRLTLGNRWPIFGAWFFVFLLHVAFGMLIGFVTATSSAQPEWAPVAPQMDWVTVALEIGLAVLLNPFAATMAAVAYFQLRRGKENVDVKELAAVFA